VMVSANGTGFHPGPVITPSAPRPNTATALVTAIR
jgi:hypothetical protein